MIDVFYTVDVEVWCGGWQDLDAGFAAGYARCIDGITSQGAYGVGFQARQLSEHGLRGVFFVEPLFAGRFGVEPLRCIVAQIQEAGQEVQLHLHTEWVDESRTDWLADRRVKRQHLFQFPLADQQALIAVGRDLLHAAGVESVSAFRAGNFGANTDTLRALSRLGFALDSSVNARHRELWPDLGPGQAADRPFRFGTLFELPMTVFDDGTAKPRQVALTAVSVRELEGLLWQAAETGRASFVILAHGFELLGASPNRLDKTVLRRFQWLCEFLARHRDVFNTRGMGPEVVPSLLRSAGVHEGGTAPVLAPLRSPWHRTLGRQIEQALRRRHVG